MTNFINRILGDFDYLRGHTEMESAEVKDAFTDPGGTTHTGTIGGSSEWEVNTDGELVPKDGEPVSIGEVSVSPEKRQSVTDDGAWCWIQDPRAVSHNGTTYVGWVRESGDIVVGSLDHTDGTSTTTTLNAGLDADDHASPAILIRNSDNRIMAFYSEHTGQPIRYRVSTDPEDVSAFDAEQTMTPAGNGSFTYMNPRQRSDGRIYLFFRSEVSGLWMTYSDDGGATWQGDQEVIAPSGTRTYFKLGEFENGRLDMALSRATGDAPLAGKVKDIRHCYFEDGSLYDQQDNDLGALPITDTDAPAVYDSGADGNDDAWVYDCATHNGTPEILAATFPAFDDHRWTYARWTDGGWNVAEITTAGQFITKGINGSEYYAPGGALTHSEPGRVVLSRGGHEGAKIQRWETDDNGESWAVTDYSGAERQHVRPAVPRNHDDLDAVWMAGKYNWYKNGGYQTGISFGRSPDDAPATKGGYRHGGARLSVDADPTQTVASGGFAQVVFDDIDYDHRGESDVANDQITVERSGLYLLNGSLSWDPFSAAGQAFGRILVNGTPVQTLARVHVEVDESPYLTGQTVMTLDKGDTITMEAYQDSGSGQDIAGFAWKSNLEVIQFV